VSFRDLLRVNPIAIAFDISRSIAKERVQVLAEQVRADRDT
jgi:hypothetical protein